MRPAVATVLSARPWEHGLVRLARSTALLRVVARAWEPSTIDGARPEVVVVGGETAWLSRGLVDAWHRLGRFVVGVHAAGSSSERATLTATGVDVVLPDDDVERILLAASRPLGSIRPAGSMYTVVGTRGAPGRSTVAMALARSLPGATLVDSDPQPNLGPLLGIPPGPSYDDLLDDLRLAHAPPLTATGGLRVLAPLGAPTDHAPPPEVLSWLRSEGPVVVDTGPFPGGDLPAGTTQWVLVVDASALGLIRTAAALATWDRATPHVVLNRAPASPSEAIRACRSATGLDPAAVIPWSTEPQRAADAALANVLG